MLDAPLTLPLVVPRLPRGSGSGSDCWYMQPLGGALLDGQFAMAVA
ncbi:hypothetical protein [Aquipuribacter hungaricus]